ncbi:STAS/SEC14 domain-containing protein [Micromonospora sp. CPCC 206061]|uniref:STAS/SEC14 domain-containing protein n=1 Tax=Micromonospora sp. CPCC 206061 TaxID=3122410 RepID=UPI002FF30251
MLTSTVIGDTNIVMAAYDGALTEPEVTVARERLADVIAQHGKARMLVEYGDVDFGKMEPRAVWEDLKSAGLMRDVEKAAVLTDTRWVKALSKATGAVAPTDIQVYDTRQRAEALSWLQS